MSDTTEWLAGANALNQSLAQIGQVSDNFQARKFAEKMYDRQTADIRRNWEIQNAYDSPTMVLSRLRAAGINPAFLMSQGSASLGLSGSNMQAPSPQSPSYAPLAAAAQFDVVGPAQADLMKAQADNLRATTPGNVKLQDAEYQKLMKDLDEADSRIGVNEATISHMSAQEKEIFARLALDTARLSLDRDAAQAQIDLWNSQVGYNESLKIKTREEYEELVAFRELRRKGLDLSNQEIQKRMNLDQAQIKHLAAIDYDMGRRFAAEYGTEGTAKFQKQLMKDQSTLAKKQADYWEDYKKDPRRYQMRVSKATKEVFENATTYQYE